MRTGERHCHKTDDNYWPILRQKKASTKVRWQEMVLKLHISAPAVGGRHLLDKAGNSQEEEVGNCLEI